MNQGSSKVRECGSAGEPAATANRANVANGMPGAEVARAVPDREEPLLPCPFCGCAAQMNYALCDYWGGCQMCLASTEMCKTRTEAAAAWNRRVAGERGINAEAQRRRDAEVGRGVSAEPHPQRDDEDGDELVRIRHTRSGRYLNVAMENCMIQRIMQPETALKFCWTDRIDSASDGTRLTARKTASAYIALTGDHDVELESVEGGEA